TTRLGPVTRNVLPLHDYPLRGLLHLRLGLICLLSLRLELVRCRRFGRLNHGGNCGEGISPGRCVDQTSPARAKRTLTCLRSCSRSVSFAPSSVIIKSHWPSSQKRYNASAPSLLLSTTRMRCRPARTKPCAGSVSFTITSPSSDTAAAPKKTRSARTPDNPS